MVPGAPLMGPMGGVGIETVSETTVKLATTSFGPAMEREAEPLFPERSPVQPEKLYPGLAVATRVTVSSSSYQSSFDETTGMDNEVDDEVVTVPLMLTVPASAGDTETLILF